MQLPLAAGNFKVALKCNVQSALVMHTFSAALFACFFFVCVTNRILIEEI
jgi:hypothetical protein